MDKSDQYGVLHVSIFTKDGKQVTVSRNTTGKLLISTYTELSDLL